MAKSKTLTKTKKEDKKPVEAPLTTKVANGSPYQLDPAQVEKAAAALVSHMRKHAQAQEEKAGKKSLVADEDDAEENDQPIFLNVATKTHVHDSQRLKPTKLPLPHPIIGDNVRICIFTKDPQRAYKDLVASDSFPAPLRSKIGRVLGLDKLKKKYKSYESKRQLLAEYDLFMVDDRILKIVADFLGKIFYGTKAKRPLPIRLTAGAPTPEKGSAKKTENVVGTPQGVAKEIEAALHATYVSMSPSLNTSVKVGTLSMTPVQLKQNIEAVVERLVDRHIEHKWRNVRRLEIKGPTTKSLPIWLFDEMWTDESQVLEHAPVLGLGNGSEKKGEKKRKWDEWEEEMLDEDELAQIKEKRARKNKASKKEGSGETGAGAISKEKRSKLKKAALQSVPEALIASS